MHVLQAPTTRATAAVTTDGPCGHIHGSLLIASCAWSCQPAAHPYMRDYECTMSMRCLTPRALQLFWPRLIAERALELPCSLPHDPGLRRGGPDTRTAPFNLRFCEHTRPRPRGVHRPHWSDAGCSLRRGSGGGRAQQSLKPDTMLHARDCEHKHRPLHRSGRRQWHHRHGLTLARCSSPTYAPSLAEPPVINTRSEL